MTKGILIDAANRTITEVQVGDYKDIQAKIGCDCFTVTSLPKNEDLYVDDEGLLKVNIATPFFYHKDYPYQAFAGNGLIMRCSHKTGKSLNTKETIESVKAKVTFMTALEVEVLAKMGKFDVVEA